MRPTFRRVPAILCGLALLGALQLGPVAAQDADLERATREVFDRYAERSLTEAWRGARALEALGDEALPWIRTGLVAQSANEQLMAAKTLISLAEVEGVRAPLIALAENADATNEQRAAAIRLLSDFASPVTEKALRGLLEGDARTDATLRIATATALFEISKDRTAARGALLPLLDVDDDEARETAALTLARMGLFDGKVKRVLRDLELEPSLKGDQARLLLDQDRLMRQLEKKIDETPPPAGAANEELQRRVLTLERELELQSERLERAQSTSRVASRFPLLNDILDRVEYFYADPDRIDREKLLVAAAKGLVDSLDPFSSFMDAKDTREFYEGISGEYAGIGAQVSKDPDSDYLKILRPIYKGPAYEMGLLTDDLVTEVEGMTTQGKRLDEIVKELKGTPETPVKIKVYRRGWKDAREYTIVRRTIHLDSVRYAMLPADIGYISLAQFGDTAVEEVERALDDLGSQDMKGLILDLRNNPGGYLQAAVDLVDNFVANTDLPIVTQKAPSGRFDTTEKYATEATRGDWPLVVLVNSSSASASEIVSGALQDFGRATIVGARTYGKGSVQRLLNMPRKINEELGGETTLRLTVQYYYLPSGRSIHAKRDTDGRVVEEGGVLPDVEVEPEEIALWRLEAINKLIDDEVFREYLDEHFEKNHDAFVEVARNGDGGSTTAYPGFDEHFLPRNVSNAPIDDIRYHLRSKIRRRVEDERGQQFACDYNEDRQLQGAIVELLKKVGGGTTVESIPEYRTFAGRFDSEKKL